MNRIYQVTRERQATDDDQNTGTPSIHIAQDRQKIKVYSEMPDDLSSLKDKELFAVAEDNQEILYTSNEVTEGDMNPITSDAVARILNLIMPIGSIIEYRGSTLPDGWLWTDGSEFDSNEWPELYAALSSTTLPEKYRDYSDWVMSNNLANQWPATSSGTQNKVFNHVMEHEGDVQAWASGNTGESTNYFYRASIQLNSEAIVNVGYSTLGNKRIRLYKDNVPKGTSVNFDFTLNGVRPETVQYGYRYRNVNPYIIRGR